MDPEKFFPQKNDSKSGNEAILACFNCTVRKECAEWKQTSNSTDGIWAGEYSKRGTQED